MKQNRVESIPYEEEPKLHIPNVDNIANSLKGGGGGGPIFFSGGFGKKIIPNSYLIFFLCLYVKM